jgi:hypothetical protein
MTLNQSPVECVEVDFFRKAKAAGERGEVTCIQSRSYSKRLG